MIPRTLLPEIMIHGRHSRSWTQALGTDAPIWATLAKGGIAQRAEGPCPWWRGRVVVPLLEPHIASIPEPCYALVPSQEAMAILADKARFDRYVRERGAAHLVPRLIDLDRPTFPAVLKRTNLRAGQGVALVTSQREFEEKLASPPWTGEQVLLQEVVPARRDYVTYVVCVDGRIVWHCTYGYALAGRRDIRGPVGNMAFKRLRTRPSDLGDFEALLQPLAFSGPANIDYRLRPDGSLAIIEINPRLGGSLMRPDNLRDLAACLRAIVRHARWRPAAAEQTAAASGEVRA